MSAPPPRTRILIVEDESVVARDIQHQIEQLGYDMVGHARDGAHALALAGALRPDLVLMDVQLIGPINGIAAAQAIRTQFALPVVYLTAFAEDETIAEAKLTEPFGYLLKPFSIRELRTVIEMALYKFEVERVRRTAMVTLQHRADFLTGLRKVVTDLLSQRNVGELLTATVQQAAEVFGAAHAMILVKEHDVLVARASWTSSTAALALDPILVKNEMDPAWAAYSSGQALQTQRRADSSAQTPTDPELIGGAMLHLPVQIAGECLGVLGLIRLPSKPAFNPSEIAEAEQLADLFALIMHNAQLLAGVREALLQRERDELKLKESEARLASIIDSSRDAIITINPQQQVLLFNPAAEVVFRMPRAQALGQPIERFLPARFRSAHRKHTEGFAQGGVSHRSMGGKAQVTGLRTDGTEFPCEAEITRVTLGGETLLTVTLRDVTDRRRIEQEKATVEAQLRQSQKMEAIGQLAGGIAHDFNNMLTSILGNAALLQDYRSSPAQQKELLREISNAGNRSATLVRQLLLFSRREDPTLLDHDLNQLVKEMLKMLRRVIGENLTLQVDCAAQPLWVHADAGMLDQILMNLVVNARDAMRENGRLTISTASVTMQPDPDTGGLSVNQGSERRSGDERRRADPAATGIVLPARAGDFACLSVADDGSGMSPEVCARIFEPFFTTKETGKGTGLGLATVYGIVQLHQGWIEVESQPGQGTTFHVYLPLARAAVASPLPEVAPEAMPMMAPNGETILLAEDEATVRNLLRIVLERAGYRVLEFPNAAKALASWPQHREEVKLVITDMVMPGGVNGIELAKVILADQPEVRVILISGHGTSEKNILQQHGIAVCCIAKPFALDHVLATACALLSKQPMPKAERK